MSGSSDGAGLPVTIDAVQRQFGGYGSPSGAGDAFVFRWSADGQSLRYGTYLGGTGDESADTLLSDQQGGVWIGGTTTSRDFPVTSNALQHASGGGVDGFLTHMDSRGGLLFSTYIGGSGNDQITALARLDSDRIILVGNTSSVEKGLGGPGHGNDDGFVAVFDSRESAMTWFRRLGGGGDDHLKSVAVLRGGGIAAAGDSHSANCPNAHPGRDGWTIVLSSSGTLLADHCFGGGKIGEVRGLVAATDGSVWMTGVTSNVYEQAFVVRFQPFRTHAERTHSPQHAGLARRGPADRGAKCGTDGDVSRTMCHAGAEQRWGKFCDMARWTWLVQAATGGASADSAVLIQAAQAVRDSSADAARARALRSGRPAD
ncbi:MAG: hypothetical protein DMF94_10400 [Acidobacteria bacterium]|nr:MAG: hypothetical protein DMF94_10400 [Acidobacteriota bacterium]